MVIQTPALYEPRPEHLGSRRAYDWQEAVDRGKHFPCPRLVPPIGPGIIPSSPVSSSPEGTSNAPALRLTSASIPEFSRSSSMSSFAEMVEGLAYRISTLPTAQPDPRHFMIGR